MARIRVLAENPPPPRGYVEDQLRELRDYITRMKDELEFLLTHLGTDNLEQSLTNKILDAADSVEQVDEAEKALEGRVDQVETALGGKQDTLTFDTAPTASSTNPVTSGGVFTALEEKPSLKSFLVTAGKALEITTTNNQGAYALLLCVQGARTTTTGVYYIAGYSKNATYHINKTLADASSIAVTNSNEKIVVTNNHASDTIRFVVLEIWVSPANMLSYEVTT